jgi:hypothetical protein
MTCLVAQKLPKSSIPASNIITIDPAPRPPV